MATRLYTAGAAAISPSPASGWENTGLFNRVAGSITGSDYVDLTAATAGSGVANEDTLVAQIVYGPLAAATLTGTIKGQNGAREVNGASDARAQVTVRVIAPDASTVRGTALAMDTAALSSEFLIDAADRQNRKFPRGGAQSLTSTSITDGDYVVIEYGFRNHGTNTNNVRISGSGAGSSTDMPEDETTTVNSGTNHRPWFEFSQTLVPYKGVAPTVASSTGAALNPSITIAPTAVVATATGAAYNATISNVAPPRSVTINGTDYVGDALFSGFSLTECANRGEVGTGGFDVHDGISAMTIPAMKATIFEEPAAGDSNKRVFTGFTNDRTEEAWPDSALTAKHWAVECVDLNILASDYVLTDAETADRPAETDYVRVAWLLTTALNSVGGVGVGVVPNANTVTMEATDYRGRKAADLLAECSEAAQKLWFIYDYGAGRKLYYDLATGSSLPATAKLSDKAGDPNGSTVLAVQSVRVKKSPDRIYSKVHLTYNGGTVTVSDGAVATAYRQREAAVLDSSISDSTLATVKANALLDGSATEITEVEGLEYVVAAAYLNDIRQGQLVDLKLSRHGIAAYTPYRVIRRTVAPLPGQTHYAVSLGLADNVLASATGARGGDEIWPQKSNANDDGATVIVDRNGINIIDGAITVVNPGGTTIIDGTSDIFRVLTSGTLNATAAANNTNGASTFESGLGILTESPLMISSLSTANDPEFGQVLGQFGYAYSRRYAATSSGGAVTTDFMARDAVVESAMLLSDGGSGLEATPTISIYNYGGGSSLDGYMKYYIVDLVVF